MRKQSMTPEERASSRLSKISDKSFSSIISVTLSRLDQYYDEQKETISESVVVSICDNVLEEYEKSELLEEDAVSVTTMQTLESEMTIPSPVETPREEKPEQENVSFVVLIFLEIFVKKTLWQKVTGWPVLGLRRISPELFKTKTPVASPELAVISPTGSTEI
jgi:hypothetical protein